MTGGPSPAAPSARVSAPSVPVTSTSLIRRLLLGLTITVGMSSALVLVLLVTLAVRGEDARLRRDIDESVAEAAQLLESPLWDLDMDRAMKIGEAFAQDPRVVRLTIRDESSGATRIVQRANTADTAFRLSKVVRDGAVLGEVGVAFSRGAYRAQVWQQLKTAVLVSLIALAATLFGVRLLLRRLLRGPLQELTDVVNGYSAGEYTRPSMDVPYKEFRPIFAVLNAMGDRITSQIGDLHDANTRLAAEIQVRQDAEEGALRSRNVLAQIMDTVPMTIFWKDRQSVYLGCNMVFANIAGFTKPEELIGKTDLDLLPEALASEYLADDRDVMERNRTRQHIIHRLSLQGGGVGWMDTSKIPLVGADGRVVGVLGVGRDITKDREREEQLLHAQKLDAIGHLAGGIAHDFNNIMGAMVMELEMLEFENTFEPDVIVSLRNVRSSVDRAANLTRQLLLFSRRQAMRVQPHDLNVIVADLLRMLTRVIGETITVEFVRTGTPMMVNADAGMLEQVLMNLCLNARDAMPEGGHLTITTERVVLGDDAIVARSGERQETYARLTVADTGCGMDDDTQRRMFEPFFTTKDVGKGSGLGLATTHGIITQHHGWIDVESRVSAGTSIHIHLPAVGLAAAGELPVAHALEIHGGTETILLVEDEMLLRKLVSRALRRLGYRVIEASDGADALAAWDNEKGRVDLVLTDMVMPRAVSGLDLGMQLQTRSPALRVIIMSGYSVRLFEDEPALQGDIRFLRKPFTIPALSDAVRGALDDTASQRRPAGELTASVRTPAAPEPALDER
ncbi:MAG: ATP-binding protein [bacterium]